MAPQGSSNNSSNEEQSSVCEKCKHEEDNNISEEEEGSSSGQSSSNEESSVQNQLRIPLQHAIKHKNEQFSQTIALLQQQITNLKAVNSQKDKIIQKLKKKSDFEKTNKTLLGELQRQAQEIDNLKMMISSTTLIAHKNKSQQKSHKKSVKQIYPLATKFESDDYQIRSKQKYFNEQNFDKLRKQQKKIKFLVNKVSELQKCLQNYEQEIKWTNNFMNSFVRMAQKTGTFFNEKFITYSWSLKKKVKVSWRYFKHVLNYLLPHLSAEN